MNPDFNSLKISEEELDELTGLSRESLTGFLCQERGIREAILGKCWGDSKKLFSLLKTETVALFLSLILGVPLTLLFLDRSLTPDTQTTTLFLLKAVGLSLAITLALNFGVWLNLKPLKNVLNLINEVEKYNDTVKAFSILDQLRKTGNVQEKIVSREEVIQALNLTRDSLVSAFQTERILREHQEFIERSYELFANLENNLTALMTFHVSNQANEYGELLNEALQIGMSVHREVQKLKRH